MAVAHSRGRIILYAWGGKGADNDEEKEDEESQAKA